MNLHKYNLLILLIIQLVGCNDLYVAQGEDFISTTKPEIDEQLSTIYLYRTDSIPGYASKRVAYVNDKKLLSLHHNGFTWFKVPPGKQLIKSDIPWSMRELFAEYVPNTLEINTEANKIYYVHLVIGVSPQGVKSNVAIFGGLPVVYPEETVDYSKALILESEEIALKRLKTYKYQQSSLQ